MDILTFDVQSYTSFKSTKYNMRNAVKQHFLRVALKQMFLNFIFNRIVNLWNDLPVAIRITDQLSLFSRKVNEFYIDKFNSNEERFL